MTIDFERDHEQRPRIWRLDCVCNSVYVDPIPVSVAAEFPHRECMADITDTLLAMALERAQAGCNSRQPLSIVGCPLPVLVPEVRP